MKKRFLRLVLTSTMLASMCAFAPLMVRAENNTMQYNYPSGSMFKVSPFYYTIDAFKIVGSQSYSDSIDISDKTLCVENECTLEAAEQVEIGITKVVGGTTLEEYYKSTWDEVNFKYVPFPGTIESYYVSTYLGEQAPTYKKLDEGTYIVSVTKGGDGVSTLIIVGNGNSEKEISVYLNDQKIEFDVPPIIDENRTLVPLRAIFEAMGMIVGWDGITSTITAVGQGNSISMRVNEITATVNGKTLTMDVPSKVIDGRTFVPLRFIAESIGAKVDWDETEKRVDITYNPPKSVPLILTDDDYKWLHTYFNPSLQEYQWDYNEAEIFGGQENAEKFMDRIGFGALTIVGATKFYDLFIGWDYSVVTDADKDVYDSLIEKMIAVDESVLESSTQKNIESFLEAGGDLKQMRKDFGNIEKIYKDVYNDKEGFGIQLLNETFDKGFEYLFIDNLSGAIIDALSKYLTIASLYDAYAVTGDSALQLLNCMEADGYEKEFVAYAKEKLKCYEDMDSLVKEACEKGAESSLRSLITKTIQHIGKKGIKTIGAKLDISKEMKDIFNASSWQSICAKIIYGFIESSPTVKAADNYVVLLGMRTLNVYSKYYFSLTVEEAKNNNDFYTIEQQKKIKNLALANLNTTTKCRELLISLLEVQRDEGWKQYIERLNLKNELAYIYMIHWCGCEII